MANNWAERRAFIPKEQHNTARVITICKVIYIPQTEKEFILSLNPRHPSNRIHSEHLRPTVICRGCGEQLSSPPTHKSQEVSNALLRLICLSEIVSTWYIHWVLTRNICCWAVVDLRHHRNPELQIIPHEIIPFPCGARSALSKRIWEVAVFQYCGQWCLQRRCPELLGKAGRSRSESPPEQQSFPVSIRGGACIFCSCTLRPLVRGLCTPSQDLVVQRKMICCGCIQFQCADCFLRTCLP